MKDRKELIRRIENSMKTSDAYGIAQIHRVTLMHILEALKPKSDDELIEELMDTLESCVPPGSNILYNNVKEKIRSLLQSRQTENLKVTNQEIVKFIMDMPSVPLLQDYVEGWLTSIGVDY